ncbi:Conserved_hypothetical protein [Hexamita inflata]|uniref:Uncharacterized protein n=1 Tax=Hexamita inflata TaxID=28002 RepID=A0AA86QM37_9EUKA|nr:Conserved hypothetical protein [Hexamita inflata]
MPITLTKSTSNAYKSDVKPHSKLTITHKDNKSESQEVACVCLSKITASATPNDIKTKIFTDFSDNIKGMKQLADSCYLIYIDSKDAACNLAAKYNGAEVDGQKIHCIPMLKLIPERKFEIKLKQ